MGKARKAPVALARGTYAGCCTPVPDVRFVNSQVVSVHMHHRGMYCGGIMEPYPLDEWWLGVRAHASKSVSIRGDG